VTDPTPPAAAPARTRISPLDPWPETVTWHPVSRRLALLELLRLGFTVLFWLVVILVANQFGWPFTIPTLVVLAVFTVLRGIAVVRAVFAWGYAERERDLLVRHGLLIRRLSIVPYARMQFVDVTAGPLERAFNLATVQLHTAAAASDARIPGLPPQEASRLRDRLAALGENLGEGL
jgi:membrane protein YdbS with pleckstrin-like domain